MKLDIAYTWATYASTCALCGGEVRRRDGIGVPVAEGSFTGAVSATARWAHSRCAAVWHVKQRAAKTEHDRVGYALRKGLANATPGASMVSKVSERFSGQRPKRTTPSRGSRISKATTTNAFTAFSPTSPYAYRETDITRLVQGVCDHGIRINTDVLAELRTDDECSETVKSVSRALVGGRVFPEFSVSDVTGRVSCRKPNLGSLAKDPRSRERELVIAEDGEVLFTVDMAQVDARVVAGLCQDPAYLEQFEAGRDVHEEMAERLLGDPRKRDAAKRLVHGINFGMGKRNLADAAKLTVGEAQAFVGGMMRQFPIWVSWMETTISQARTAGSLTTVYGRTIPVERSEAHTQAVARLVQATARDAFFDGVLNMTWLDLWDGKPLAEHIRLLMHDELLFSVPASNYVKMSEHARMCLSRPWRPDEGMQPVQLPVRISPAGHSWADTQQQAWAEVA